VPVPFPCQIAPPVALESIIVKYVGETVPDALEIVARVPETLAFNVELADTVPPKENVEDIVFVVPLARFNVTGLAVLVIAVIVLPPSFTFNVPFARARFNVPYVSPPPVKFVVTAFALIVSVDPDLPAPVAVQAELRVTVDVPKLMDLEPAPVVVNVCNVKLLLLLWNVPAVNVTVDVEVNAPEIENITPVLLMSIGNVIVSPFVVTVVVPVPANVTVLDPERDIADDNVTAVPYTLIVVTAQVPE